MGKSFSHIKKIRIYKIRNEEGLFAEGVSPPEFTENGWAFANWRDIKRHLNQFDTFPKEYLNCKITERVYELTEDNAVPVETFYNDTFMGNNRMKELEALLQYYKDNFPEDIRNLEETWVFSDMKLIKAQLAALKSTPEAS